ncbi:MAG: EAL domain-containing protein [Pseudolabrys sp.]|nr:EAL domain-containing protein [Pseudolabrys sp.]MDP2296675.1 EAL domain-containing protein [Pseudolabrys sp.]
MEKGLITDLTTQSAIGAWTPGALMAAAVVAVLAVAVLVFRMTGRKGVLARAERLRADRLQQQSRRLDIALNNMSQGIVIFDADERVVFCNQRYLELSGLSADFMQPGRTFTEILHARNAIGTFQLDIEKYRRELLADIARGITKNVILEASAGRHCHVIIVPMAGGGWITTHEDITEQVAAKRIIDKQKLHLDAAISHMPQGLCMFDKDQRLIVCNKKYADLYRLTEELTKPGTPLRMILKHWALEVCKPGEVDAYVEERLSNVEKGKAYQIVNRLHDGRYIAIGHRTMAGGGWVSTHEDVTDAKLREESFRLLFDSSPMAMWVMDRETLKFLAVNDAVVDRYGYSREQFMTMTVPDLRAIDDREQFAAYLRALPANSYPQGRGGKHRKSDGTVIDVEVYSRPFTYNGHSASLTVVNDVTKTKQAADELSRTKKFLDAVIEHVPVPIVVRDVAGVDADARGARFYLFNRAYEELTGDARGQLIGKTADEIYPPDRAALVVNADNEAIVSGRVIEIAEHAIKTTANGTRLVTGKKTVIRNVDGKPQYLLTVLDDVTERRQAQARIAYLAHNDSLTDLPNRATFVEYLDTTLGNAARTGQPFAILCVDLDRFKEANDIYGHLVGDRLLREAARRLHTAAGGQFLARVGGDEFTLILTQGAQPQSALALGESLLAAFKPAFEIDGQQLQLGLTIGGAVYPADGDTATTLIANADAALYQAKGEARGSLRLFDAKLGARLHDRRELQADLQSAIARNEFFLHYQPQLTAASGEITGFESLVRWQCPKRGLVPPGSFISIAEESGLIVPLGDWILREACREAASWPLPLKIAVNISPIQFHAGDLVAQVHMILLETGLAAGRLELEITEGVLIDDFQRAVAILRKLKSLGVQIAMDDFGKGYSSLSYLHSFGFDKIKIDRSFVGDLEYNHHSMAIVRAIITLGHSLEVPVMAEGVETEGQRLLLRQEGCDGIQGYLTGRPLPIDAYAGAVGRDAAPLAGLAREA